MYVFGFSGLFGVCFSYLLVFLCLFYIFMGSYITKPYLNAKPCGKPYLDPKPHRPLSFNTIKPENLDLGPYVHTMNLKP